MYCRSSIKNTLNELQNDKEWRKEEVSNNNNNNRMFISTSDKKITTILSKLRLLAP